MKAQRTWPVRYEARLHMVGGQVRRRSVLTWLGHEKAIALAVQAGAADGPVYDVEVEELGPAPRNADGTVAVGEDLHDRMEF
jgi:hypothetical protein